MSSLWLEANSGVLADACGVCGGDGSSCMFATACTPTAGKMTSVGLWAATSAGTDLSVCLAGDVAVAVGSPCGDGCSPTVTISSGELQLDCGNGGGDSGLCLMRDRLDIMRSAIVFLHRLLFADLTNGDGTSGGGAIFLSGNAFGRLSLLDCTFTANTARHTTANGFGGAIKSGSLAPLMISGCTFISNTATYGGAVEAGLAGGTVTISGSTFDSNVADFGGAVYAVQNAVLVISVTTFASNTAPLGAGVADRYNDPEWYTDEEATAAFGGETGR